MADEYITVQVPRMTDSSRLPYGRNSKTLPLWTFPLPDVYPSDREGQILLRGGAKIRLKKAVDQFTVRLNRSIAHPHQWAKQFSCEADRHLETIGQIALRIEPARLEGAMARIRQSPEVGFATHAYSVFDPQSNPFEPEQTILYLSNQIALQFQPQTTAAQMEAIARAVGLEVLTLIPGVSKAFVYQLTDSAIVNPLKLANRLIYHPDVLLAEPNFAFELSACPSVEPFDLVLNLTGKNSRRTDRSIAIAVIDRAIDLNCPAFEGMGKIVAPLDLLPAPDADRSVEDPEKPELTSGTLCAQIAIGEETSEAFSSAGIASSCSLMPVTVGASLDDSAIEQIFDWGIRQGAAVFCWNLAGLPAELPASLRQRSAVYRAAVEGRGGRGSVVLVRSDSGWKDGSDVFCVAIDSQENSQEDSQENSQQSAAIGMGIMTGIAAKTLTANPDLTAEQVRQILQAVQAGGSALDQPGLSGAVSLAIKLALNARAELSASIEKHRMAELETLEFGDSTLQAIPDGAAAGLVCSIAVQQAGRIQDIEISLTIEHSFLGDLTIWLVSPDGEAILLQDRTLGSLNSLDVRYSFQSTPYLKSLLRRSAQGLWQIQICDAIPGHSGVLKAWQLRLGLEQPHQMS